MKNLPPPPVPQKLREILREYPENIQRLRNILTVYFENPNPLMPFDGAVWILQDALSSFISEARDELKDAESSGDSDLIRKAEAKVRLMLHASQLRGLHDLKDYFDKNKEIVG